MNSTTTFAIGVPFWTILPATSYCPEMRVCEAVGETEVVTRGRRVEVLVGKLGVIVVLDTGETVVVPLDSGMRVTGVIVSSGGVPLAVLSCEAKGV